jgi:hypothetical protein
MTVKQNDQWAPGPLRPEGNAPPRKQQKISNQWAGLIAGAALIIAWYLATRTTLIIAYGAGSMSQAQSLCGSGFGYLARGMSPKTDLACSHITSDMNWWNLAGFAGLALLAGCAAWLIWQRSRQS